MIHAVWPFIMLTARLFNDMFDLSSFTPWDRFWFTQRM